MNRLNSLNRINRLNGPPKQGGVSWSAYWKTLISATVETAAPTHVVLTFPAAANLVAADFTITDFAIASASWTGPVLTLVLTEAVLIFDGNLNITFNKTGDVGIVTNNVADDGSTVDYFDYTDQTAITKDVNNLVQVLWNKPIKNSTLGAEENSGSTVVYGIYQITACQTNYFYSGNAVGDVFCATAIKTLDANNKVRRYAGNHLGNQTLSERPLWTVDGILFDGSNDRLSMATRVLNQPVTVYLVFNPKTWTQYDQIISFEGNSAWGLNQAQSSPRMRANAGTASNDSANSDMALDTVGIVRIVFNGANSRLQVNEQTPIAGNFGTGTIGAISIGDLYLGGLRDANICLQKAIVRSIDDSGGMYDPIYNALKKKV